LGLHQTGLLPIAWLYRERRVEFARTFGSAGAFLTGLAFAVGWTPCVGPILGSILTLASSRGNLGEGILLLTFYAAGLALPFFMLALAFERISPFLIHIKRYLKILQYLAGGLLFIMGILMLTCGLSAFNSFVLRWTSGWSLENLLKK
jgi:cytochrome c-type biogenesis protein